MTKPSICLHLDNAHVAQSRLILLDATLIFFLSLTMYSYIRFRKLRYLYVQTSYNLPRPLLTIM
jgi:dolichyl-phosphate-mannose-protein mannosyltransferase